MPYDYSKLSGKIKEVCGTQGVFAERMHLSERSVSLKLGAKIAWKQPEIIAACELLNIPVTQIPEYFFTLKVQ